MGLKSMVDSHQPSSVFRKIRQVLVWLLAARANQYWQPSTMTETSQQKVVDRQG